MCPGRLFFASVLLTIIAITSQESEFRTFSVSSGDHPYVAELAFQEVVYRAVIPVCGAAIVNEKHVITASHCFDIPRKGAKGQFLIMVGSVYSLVNEGSWYRIQKHFTTRRQKQFGAPVDDIAVIRIWGRFVFDDFVDFIPMVKNSRIPIGKKATVFGWGQYTQVPEKLTSYRLLGVEMEIVSGNECNSLFEDFSYDYNICAKPEINTGTCDGDSGGPLVIDNTLYGILSYGHTECGNGAPEVYVHVGVFHSWIHEIITQEMF